MAYLRKRGNKWSYQLEWLDPVTGTRRTKSKGGFTRKSDARVEAEELEKELREGSFVEENNITLK